MQFKELIELMVDEDIRRLSKRESCFTALGRCGLSV